MNASSVISPSDDSISVSSAPGSIGGFEVAVADRAKRLERIDAGEVVEISERIDARTHAAAGGDVVDDRHRVAGDLARTPSLAR